MFDERGPPPQLLPPPPARWLQPRRRKKLLVLDLNGLLVWRARKGNVDLKSLPRKPDATIGQFHVFARPHLRDFLVWCSERFHVAVWSTAISRNLQPVVDWAWDGLQPPVVVFDQSHCTETDVAHPDDATETRFLLLKELSRLWQDARIVSALGRIGPSETLLVDDSPYKAAANPAHTAVHPKEWFGPADEMVSSHAALSATGELRRVLAAVAAAGDVPSAVRRLFGGDPAALVARDFGSDVAVAACSQRWRRSADCPLLRTLLERRPEWSSPASSSSTAQAATNDFCSSTATACSALSAPTAASATLLGMLGFR